MHICSWLTVRADTVKQLLQHIVWSIIMRVNVCTYSVQIHFLMSWFGLVWKQSVWCRGWTNCAFQPGWSFQNSCWQQELHSSLLLKGRKTGGLCFSLGDWDVWSWSWPLSPVRFCLSIWKEEKQYSLVWYGSDCQGPCDPHREGDTSCYILQMFSCD